MEFSYKLLHPSIGLLNHRCCERSVRSFLHRLVGSDPRQSYLVHRGAHKVTEFDVISKQVTNFAGSGHTESRDGCDLTASFSQPTGVCCEKDSHSIFVVDSSSGRFRLITSV